MCMQVDETGRYDMTSGIDHGVAVQCELADCNNLAIVDRNTADRIEPGLGVDHPTARDDDLSRQRSCCACKQKEE
jgi:hypothetical protein